MTEISTPLASPAGEPSATPPLSEVERVVDTFIAPSKTFTDILRSASWWLPFLIILVVGYAFIFTVEKRVSWETVMENGMKVNTSQADQVNNAPAADQLEQVDSRQNSDELQNIFVMRFRFSCCSIG